ncbi:MAG: hypothetical protein ACI9G9_000815 [Psychromonas sp.]|jgi:hypothetical protein
MLVAILLVQSCGTVITGTGRNVFYDSNPRGAKVFVNGIYAGITPLEIRVQPEDHISYNLDGYRETVVIMDSKFNLVCLLNGFGLISWTIDLITGAIRRVDVDYVKANLRESVETTQLNEFLKKGNLVSVNIDQENKTIVSTIVLQN